MDLLLCSFSDTLKQVTKNKLNKGFIMFDFHVGQMRCDTMLATLDIYTVIFFKGSILTFIEDENGSVILEEKFTFSDDY